MAFSERTFPYGGIGMAYGYNNKFYVEPWEVVSGAVISGASQMIYPNGTAEDTQLIGAFSSS